jgi:hypothetical protein
LCLKMFYNNVCSFFHFGSDEQYDEPSKLYRSWTG